MNMASSGRDDLTWPNYAFELRCGFREAVGGFVCWSMKQVAVEGRPVMRAAHGRAASEARSLEAPWAPGIVEGAARQTDMDILRDAPSSGARYGTFIS
jgi:hypothetical protein